MDMADKELCDCMSELAKAFKGHNPPIKGPLRAVIGAIAPILIASADPRVKALGLGLQGLSLVFLGKARESNGGKKK